MNVAFDIETQPNPFALEQLPEPQPPRNYTDPAKIEAWKKKAKDEQKQKAALDPSFGQLVCATFASHAETTTLLRTQDGTATTGPADNDSKLVQDVMDKIAQHALEGDTLATFNGHGFDIPYIMRRAMIHRAKVPSLFRSLATQRQSDAIAPSRSTHVDVEHIDVMLALHNAEVGGLRGTSPVKASRNLHYYAGTLLSEYPPDLPEHEDKTLIGTLFDKHDYGRVINLCAWDAHATLSLAGLVQTYL